MAHLSTAPAQVPQQVVRFGNTAVFETQIWAAGDQMIVPATGPNPGLHMINRDVDGFWSTGQVLPSPSTSTWIWGEIVATCDSALAVSFASHPATPYQVHLFEPQGPGIPTWTNSHVLTELDVMDSTANTFGSCLALSSDGEWLLVGAHRTDFGGLPAAGRAYFFNLAGPSPVLVGHVNATTPNAHGQFGVHGFVDQDLAVIWEWATNTLHSYRFDGSQWVPTGTPVTLASANNTHPIRFAAQGQEILVVWGESIQSTWHTFVRRYKWQGQGTQTTLVQQQTLDILAATQSVAWTDDDTIVIGTQDGEALRFQRSSPSADFQPIDPIRAWIKRPATLPAPPSGPYTSDEILFVENHGFTLSDLVVATPGPEWIGNPACRPNNGVGGPHSPSLGATGDVVSPSNNIQFHVGWASPGQFGYLLGSPNSGQQMPALSLGTLCLSSPIAHFRNDIRLTDASGGFHIPLDRQAVPSTANPVIQANEQWHFQAWLRDPLFGSVFTNSVEILFL